MTAGTGHRRAAEAVAEALRQRDPRLDVACVDLLAFVPRWLRWAYPATYEWLVRWAPWLWAAGYYSLDQPVGFRLLQPWRRLWNAWMARRFLAQIAAQPPDVIVTTHFFPTDVVGHAQAAGRLSVPLVVVITDLFPHRFWLTARPSVALVGTEEVKRLCVQRGLDADRIRVVGIPIRPAFARTPDRATVMMRLGLDAARQTILIASGGMGVGPIEGLVQRFLQVAAQRLGRLQLVVICGQNRRLAERLRRRCAGAALPVRIEGFVETMPDYMRAADLLITKPGGLTVVEALAMELPMLFVGAIPGQEQFNAAYAVSHRAACWLRSPSEVVSTALHLMDHPEQLEQMRHSAAAAGRPDAAFQTADLVRSYAQAR